MCAFALKGNGTVKQQVEELAVVLDRCKLSHLEYNDGQTHIVLKRESVQPLSELPPATSCQTTTESSAVDSTEDTAGTTDSTKETADSPAYAPADIDDNPDASTAQTITAPLVGLAYRAKEPGSKPFVEVGDKVEKGDALCLIEAMKMFNEITATHAGTIDKVHFADGELVEYGAPLFSIQSLSLDH